MAVAFKRGVPELPGSVRFSDFAPDADPLTPGILTDMSNLYPSAKGWRSYPSAIKYSSNSLPSAALGTWAGQQAGSGIVIAGVSGQLYKLNDQAWATSGSAVSASSNRWRFDMYGTDLIAVNGVDAPRVKASGGDFAALAGSPPTASIVQATGYSIFLIETNSAKWWSTLSDILWTPSVATQTVTATLDHGAGNITAAQKLRNGICLFKRKAFSFGRFIGPPLYWDFGDGVSDQVGAPSQEAVANLGDILMWPGPDDFYMFDSYALNRIPNDLKEWFFANLDANNDAKITARWDQAKSLVFWHFPSTAASPAGTLDTWICYNLRTGKWSKGSETIDMPVFTAIPTGDLTYAGFTTTYPTYGDVGSLTYGDLQSRNVDVSGVIKASDHALYLYNGAPGSAYFTTHYFGDRHSLWQISDVRPFFSMYPASGGTVQVLKQMTQAGGAETNGRSASLRADGRFNLVDTARLQRLKITGNSEFEVTGIEAEIDFAGEN